MSESAEKLTLSSELDEWLDELVELYIHCQEIDNAREEGVQLDEDETTWQTRLHNKGFEDIYDLDQYLSDYDKDEGYGGKLYIEFVERRRQIVLARAQADTFLISELAKKHGIDVDQLEASQQKKTKGC